MATNALQDGWVQLLCRYQWHWFCTMTFREAVHPEAADKRFRLWASELNRSLFGPRWHRRPARAAYWCRGLEFQRRDVIHYHALLGSAAKDLNAHAVRELWSARWNRLAGFARIEAVRDSAESARYLSKYVAKGGQIDLSNNLSSIPTRDSSGKFESTPLVLEHSDSD